MIDKIKMYRKGLAVERLHTVRHITPYTNGSHSANAALLAIELCRANVMIHSYGTVAQYMLLHDIAEGYVGDMPANVKWANPELAAELSRVEAKWEAENLELPDLDPMEKEICKAADYIELGIYCVEELQLGNTNVNHVLVNIINVTKDRFSHLRGVPELLEYLMARGEA